MKNGKEEAVHLFVEDYTKTLGKSNMDSFMFCQYMLINIQVGVMKFVEKMGVEKANIDRTFKDYKQQNRCSFNRRESSGVYRRTYQTSDQNAK